MLVCLIINLTASIKPSSVLWGIFRPLPQDIDISCCLWLKGLFFSSIQAEMWLMIYIAPKASTWGASSHIVLTPKATGIHRDNCGHFYFFVKPLQWLYSITFHYSGPLTYWKINSFCWSKVVCLRFINWSAGQAAVLGGETRANGSAEVAGGTKAGLWRVAIRQAASTLFVRTQE